MKRLLLAALFALACGPALASSTITCNSSAYTWPDQFQGYSYVQNWPLLVNDCITDMAGKVTAASTSATNAANSATTATNAAVTATTSAATQGTSTTSLTIGTGSQSLTVQTGKGFLAGMPIRIAKSDGTANWIDTTVATYNSGTGALTTNSGASATGSGTYASWNVFAEGPQGITGASSGIVLLSVQTISSPVASVDFTSALSSTYDQYVFEIANLIPATDGANPKFRVGIGGVFQTTNYKSSVIDSVTDSTTLSGANTTDGILLCGTTGNAATDGFSGLIRIYSPANTARYKEIATHGECYSTTATRGLHLVGAGYYVGAASAITDGRIYFSSGNVASGTIRLYGVQKQ